MSIVEQNSDVVRLRGSGDDGLAAAFAAHHERLERIVELRLDQRLASRVDTDDVMQEAYLEAKKRLTRYLDNPSVPLFVWLRGVTLDTLIHVHRRHLAKIRDAGLEVSLQAGRGQQVSSISLASWLVGDFTSPSEAAMRDELAAQVAQVLDIMDEIDREVLILRHFEQLSNNEVASVVGVKKAAASRRYLRALKRFREVTDRLPWFDLKD